MTAILRSRMNLTPLGDSAILANFSDEHLPPEQLLPRALAASRALDAAKISGVLEVTSSYESVAIFLDPSRASASAERSVVEDQVRSTALAVGTTSRVAARTIEVPVCYEKELALDLDRVADHTGLTMAKIIELHVGADYQVACIGFLPGFPFLYGLPRELHVPRLTSPRTRLPTGSVAIANGQAGVYPLESPGGWNVIGRTPLKLFDPNAEPPALLRAGDRVRFRRISRPEFDDMNRKAD